jgi:ABC-type hemin transport system substrate-binding protein
MKTINVTEAEHAELLKLHAKKIATASDTTSREVVRAGDEETITAAGTSEGAKEGWTHRINFHSNPDRREFLKKTRHIESVDGELEGIGSMLANKETAELAKNSPHTYKVEELQKASAKASDATSNTEVIHCRSHSASGPVLAAEDSVGAFPLIWK